ncbi:hypothetical protein V5O48_010137 [Marasmius crinis-equi]|uniref:Ricin B lectin domain-containing protein n=1 Tax=Marasmius crinis-equi TaxID=585013 RepID=A0ABR3F9A6_9AGAR
MHFAALLTLSVASAVLATPSPRPRQAGRQIHPNGNTDLCLAPVFDPATLNMPIVSVYNCADRTGIEDWIFNEGDTKIQSASSPDFCLENQQVIFGHGSVSSNTNGAFLRIGVCGTDATTQWHLENNKFSVPAQFNPNNQCLDFTNGELDPGRAIQTWECTDGNTNQIWTF